MDVPSPPGGMFLNLVSRETGLPQALMLVLPVSLKFQAGTGVLIADMFRRRT